MTPPKNAPLQTAVEAVVEDYVELVRMLGNSRAPEFLEINITMAQAKVLMLLGAVGEMRMSAMPAQLGVGLSTVSGLVDRLVEGGYAFRRDDPDDRRQVLVSASAAGLAFIDRFQDLSSSRLRELLCRLDEADVQHIRRSLEILRAAAAEGPLGPDQPAIDQPTSQGNLP